MKKHLMRSCLALVIAGAMFLSDFGFCSNIAFAEETLSQETMESVFLLSEESQSAESESSAEEEIESAEQDETEKEESQTTEENETENETETETENETEEPGFTGLQESEDGVWYVVNGEKQTEVTGLITIDGQLYNIVEGRLAEEYTGLVQHSDETWYYIVNGVWDNSYTGLTQYYSTWYYVENGVLNWDYTGLTKYYDTWYYVEKGVLNWDFTGIVDHGGGKFYVEKGVLNDSFTGEYTYKSCIYYVKNGEVDHVVGYVYMSYSTKYSESNTNRTTNLKLACKAINGTLLKNGGVFDFNNIVGERTAAKGYKEATIYENGQETGGIGGGICQVASTLFNAALRANFKINERHQHSLTVHYVPLGYDAAIAWGSKNHRFTNNSGTNIRVRAKVANGTLSITFVADKNIKPPAVTTKVTEKDGVYTLKRYVDGKCNYTTTSDYLDN